MREEAFIYLLQDGCDVGSSTYKVGKTVQKDGDTRRLSRRSSYSFGTSIKLLDSVPIGYVDIIEKDIIDVFNKLFTCVRGREWFDGNFIAMKECIRMVTAKYERIQSNESVVSSTLNTNAIEDEYAPLQTNHDHVYKYRCLRCDYQTNIRTHFMKHLNRKVACPPIMADVELSSMIPVKHGSGCYACSNCPKRYSSKSGLHYHAKFCKKRT